jgi:hypothetical protein
MSDFPACAGPVYFADQGIEVCATCGGCICCDFVDVDHSTAEYECLTDEDGVCRLRAHEGRPCTKKAEAKP